MLFEIQELERHPIDFKQEFAPGEIELGDEVRQAAVLKSAGRAQLVEERHGKHQIIQDIRLNGDLSTRLELACARCLEPVVLDVQRDFDLLYRPQGSDAGREEYRSQRLKRKSAITRAREYCSKTFCGSRFCWLFR